MHQHQTESFGALLRQHRRSAQLTQEALAARTTVSVEAISALERGTRRAPRRITAELLADGLDLPETARARFLAVAAAGSRLARVESGVAACACRETAVTDTAEFEPRRGDITQRTVAELPPEVGSLRLAEVLEFLVSVMHDVPMAKTAG